MKYRITTKALFVGTSLLTVVLGTAGCTDPDNAARQLENAGYANVQLHGYAFMNCSKDDFYHDEFTATGPTGRPVSGVVCAGLLFKGATIRLD